MAMTRAEHMAWAKQRALEELGRGSGVDAMASMLSDLYKHTETERSAPIGALIAITVNHRDPEAVRRFIEGFN